MSRIIMIELIFNNLEKYESKIKSKLPKKIASRVSKEKVWINSLETKEKAMVGYLFDTQEWAKNIDISVIINGEMAQGTDYEQLPNMKKMFLVYIFDKWESDIPRKRAIVSLKEIEAEEKAFGKSCIFFNKEEMEDYIKNHFKEYGFYGMQAKAKIFSELVKFYKNDIDNDAALADWAFYYDRKNLNKLLQFEESQQVVTRDDLLNLHDEMLNSQYGIMPLLLFEGLRFSTDEKKDDIRFLKTKNVYQAQLVLEERTDIVKDGLKVSGERTIDIEEDVSIRIKRASAVTLLTAKDHRMGFRTYPVNQTEYVLKAQTKKGRGDYISHPTGRTRLSYALDQLSASNIYLQGITNKDISNCGKAYYIQKYMDEGDTERQAIIKVLKRFGEWGVSVTGDEKSEQTNYSNRNRVERLRKLYKMYLPKKKN